MASPTKKSKVRRDLRKASAGAKRKADARKFGTTPTSLPLNRPNANEKAHKSS